MWGTYKDVLEPDLLILAELTMRDTTGEEKRKGIQDVVQKIILYYNDCELQIEKLRNIDAEREALEKAEEQMRKEMSGTYTSQ